MRRLGVAAVVALAIVGAAIGVSIVRTPSAVASGIHTSKSSSLPSCTGTQLHIAYYGSSGAAGTVVSAFQVTNSSTTACKVSGYPSLGFYSGPFASPRTLKVTVAHLGGGVGFARRPQSVVLEPVARSSPLALSRGAGLVLTSADFAADGSGHCPQLSSFVLQGIRVPLWYPANVCRGTIDVSAFFRATSLFSYTARDLAPSCTASELTVTSGAGGAGLGHVRLPIEFRDVAAIPCRLSGYPSVTALGGRGDAKAAPTLTGYLGGLAAGVSSTPIVTIEPGEKASALVEGLDTYDQGQQGCPAYSGLLVTAPYASRAVRVDVAFDGCTALEVHPVVAGTIGRSSS